MRPRLPSFLAFPTASTQAAVLALTAGAIFALGNVLIRQTTQEMHPFQVVFFRNLFGALLLAPWALQTGLNLRNVRRTGLYVSRALTALCGMSAWFYGLSVTPLAVATSISFTVPLLAVAGGGLFLGEKIGMWRWAATGLGLVGVLIILRPGFGDLQAGALIVLLGGFFSAASLLQARALARSESAPAMVMVMALLLTPLSLGPAALVWRTPSWEVLGWSAVLAAILNVGHLALARAFQSAEASALAPYDYARLPLTALAGWLAFGETMDAAGCLGSAIIVAAAFYNIRGETRKE